MRKLLMFIAAMAVLLVFPIPEAESHGKHPHARRTQKHLSVPAKKYVKPKAKRHVARPSVTVPSGPLITRDMLTREDREGVKALDIYEECMRSQDPVDQVFRFFDRAKTRASIVGSNEGIAYELCAIDALDITRFETVADIDKAVGKTLFRIANGTVAKHDDLDEARYVASPWVHAYLIALAEDYRQEIISETGREPEKPYFTISSIVRSMDIQRRQRNSPARCMPDGGLCSSHTTGTTFDITLKNVSALRTNILAKLLRDDRSAGVSYFIYERRPGPHMHVFVYPPILRDGLRDYAAKQQTPR